MSATSGEPSSPQRRRAAMLRYCATAVLLLGLLWAEIVYMLAGDQADLADQLARDKMYQHNLQVMGGKAAVLADSFNRWLASLWQGRALAYTIAVLTVVAATALFVAARLCEPPSRGRHAPEKR